MVIMPLLFGVAIAALFFFIFQRAITRQTNLSFYWPGFLRFVALGVIGFFIAILLLFLLYFFPNLDQEIAGQFIAPIIEELTKLMGIALLFRILSYSPFNDNLDAQGILAGLAFGTGFGLSENIFTLVNSYELFIVRSLSTMPLHMFTAGIIGFGIGRNRRYQASWLPWLITSLAVHILYNLGSTLPQPLSAVSILVLFFALVLLFRMIRSFSPE